MEDVLTSTLVCLSPAQQKNRESLVTMKGSIVCSNYLKFFFRLNRCTIPSKGTTNLVRMFHLLSFGGVLDGLCGGHGSMGVEGKSQW